MSSGIATFTGVQHDTAVSAYYLKASDGTITICSSVTQVYPALAMTPTTLTGTTLGTQAFAITGGVPPIVCNNLSTNNSQGSVTSSCYTGGGCTGDYCMDYSAGYYGNGVTDVIAVQDTANTVNALSSTITVDGPTFTETSGNGAYGTVAINTTLTYTINNGGNANATNLAITFGGTDPTLFAIGGTDNCSTTTLNAAANCTVDIDFLAGAAGAGTYNATATIRGGNGGEVVIILSGTK